MDSFPAKLLEDSETNFEQIFLSDFLKYSSAFSNFVFGLPSENPSVATLLFWLCILCSDEIINSSSLDRTELALDFSFNGCRVTILSGTRWVCSDDVEGNGLIWFKFVLPLYLRMCSNVEIPCFLNHT